VKSGWLNPSKARQDSLLQQCVVSQSSHFMKHSLLPTLLVYKLKAFLLLAGVLLFLSGTSYAQAPRPALNCLSSPISLAKPYIGYDGITNETAALYSWCKNDTLANIQSYRISLKSALEGVSNQNNLSDPCKAEYVRRKQELGVIRELVLMRQ
jgi:hypothetical protein